MERRTKEHVLKHLPTGEVGSQRRDGWLAYLAQQFFQSVLSGRAGLCGIPQVLRLLESRDLQQLRRTTAGFLCQECQPDDLRGFYSGRGPWSHLQNAELSGDESCGTSEQGTFGKLRGARDATRDYRRSEYGQNLARD